MPTEVTPVETLVERAFHETGIKKSAIQTAIWRLIEQGQLYQPEPGKVKRI
jgi:hypothetical protein